jgi:hypothetical protein
MGQCKRVLNIQILRDRITDEEWHSGERIRDWNGCWQHALYTCYIAACDDCGIAKGGGACRRGRSRVNDDLAHGLCDRSSELSRWSDAFQFRFTDQEITCTSLAVVLYRVFVRPRCGANTIFFYQIDVGKVSDFSYGHVEQELSVAGRRASAKSKQYIFPSRSSTVAICDFFAVFLSDECLGTRRPAGG